MEFDPHLEEQVGFSTVRDRKRQSGWYYQISNFKRSLWLECEDSSWTSNTVKFTPKYFTTPSPPLFFFSTDLTFVQTLLISYSNYYNNYLAGREPRIIIHCYIPNTLHSKWYMILFKGMENVLCSVWHSFSCIASTRQYSILCFIHQYF